MHLPTNRTKKIDFARTLSGLETTENIEQNNKGEYIDPDKTYYKCLVGPGEYNPTTEDLNDFCSKNRVRRDDFLSCPRFKAVKLMKEAERSVIATTKI